MKRDTANGFCCQQSLVAEEVILTEYMDHPKGELSMYSSFHGKQVSVID